ncbi:MAG TPA: carbohydrate kinase family protein [Candidatus Bathyarchaeia archaeon]|nr:carbohydrate kinase family protein [Candidatus Bathyarchaeia archaeon]
MTQFDFVGFGALNVDKLFKVNRIAHAEEESQITIHSETCGGSAANTAVGLARLSCKVGFVGKVGEDREGNMLLKDFGEEGVDVNGIVLAKYGESGTVMGFVDEQGQRALYIHSGVNDAIGSEEISRDYATQARFIHLSSFVGEKSFQTQKEILKTLPENVKVSFDPGVLYARRGIKQIEPIIKRTYLMMPNAIEIALITSEKDYEKAADILLEEGVKVVAVKLGSEGCYITDGAHQHKVNAFKVPVVDTTGAGDAFNAGFLYGLLKGMSLLECGRLGNFVASRCVMKMGARTSLPYAKELKLLDQMAQ